MPPIQATYSALLSSHGHPPSNAVSDRIQAGLKKSRKPPTIDDAKKWHGVDLNWAYTVLLRGIQRRTACVHRSYEVLHDSLVRLALLNKRQQINQPHAYLRTIVGNVLADGWADEQRWVALPEVDENQNGHNESGPVVELAPSAEYMSDLRERLHNIQRILDCLPPRCREVFWLFRVEGYSQQEIAQRLGVSLKAIEYQVARALVDLQSASEILT